MATSTSVWYDQLTADESAQLGRGAGTIMQPRPDVLVIGGGIVGMATAVACRRAGAVMLVEAGRLGSGASGGAAGLLLPEGHAGSDPEPFVTLARSSLELWKELEQTVPGGVGLTEMDWIVPGACGGVLVRRQARVNPLRAVARLAATVPSVATGTAATSVTVKGSRVVTVATTAGDVHPGAVVFATGMPPRLDGLAHGPPARRIKGHLLVTEPSPVRLAGSLFPVATQLEDGGLLAGGTLDIGDDSPGVRPDVVDAILAELYAGLPQAAGLRVAYQWCCFRPWHPDGFPVIDRVPGLDNAWLTSGHYRTGILMAPVTAQIISRWISASNPPPEAGPWSSTRFG
jgi:glycine oxidase